MKKTQFIELIKLIKETFVSFISITIFVTLAVAIFAGISWTGGLISKGVIDVSNNASFHDIELTFLYGYDEDDIRQLKETKGVDEIESYKSCYEFFKLDDQQYQAIVMGKTSLIDTPVEVVGDMPNSIGEIGIDAMFASKHNIEVGDKIIFEDDDATLINKLNHLLTLNVDKIDFENIEFDYDDDASYLKTKEYKVTALIKSPRFLANDSQCYGISPINQINLDCFMYVDNSSFDSSSFSRNTNILIKSEELTNLDTFSDSYDKKIEDLSSSIKEKANELSKKKYDKIDNQIDNLVINLDNKIEETENDLKKANDELIENKNKLIDAKNELDSAKTKLIESEDKINNSQKEFDKLNNSYNTSRVYLVNLVNVLVNYESDVTLVDKVNETGAIPILQELIVKYQGESKLSEFNLLLQGFNAFPQIYANQLKTIANDTISYGDKLVDDSKNELNKAKNELKDGWSKYNSGIEEYNNNEKKINELEIKINESTEQLVEAKDKVELLKKEVDDIEFIDCNVLLKTQNSGIIVCKTLYNMYNKLRYSMAGLFVIVGLLVCYSAISRIINMQSKIIGTKKALGINEKEVTLFFLLYTSIAVVIGCIFGVLSAYYIVESIFINVLKESFVFTLNRYFAYGELFMILPLEIILLLITTYFACRNILKRKAKDLLTNNQEKNNKQRFYEKTKIWKKMSLLTQTIINNCANDSKRVFGTLIGIAGSTALIVTALTFNDNFMDSFTFQYKNIFHFDTLICVEPNDFKQVEDTLKNEQIEYAPVYRTRMYIKCPDNSFIPSHFFVINDQNKFIKLVNILPFKTSKNELYKGYWAAGSYCNYYHTNYNDKLTYIETKGDEHIIDNVDYFRHYLPNHFTFVDADTYKNTFGEKASTNCFLVDSSSIGFDELRSKVKDKEGFMLIENFYNSSKSSFDYFQKLSQVMVMVYLSLSIVMSFLVLLNLLTMFVDEKKYELIVLMINGFSVKDAKRYIYSDTIVLSFIGIVLGIAIGTIVGNVSVSAFETAATLLNKKIDILACVVGLIGAIVLTIIVSAISLSKIKSFKLSDINKA